MREQCQDNCDVNATSQLGKRFLTGQVEDLGKVINDDTEECRVSVHKFLCITTAI